ncbi:hypothetical protein EDB80DRAFT_692184 [Ilyonectria destructans]|nr:hypothetical protein EDB80DRAFT_692184 [Ilyonectria destructans]
MTKMVRSAGGWDVDTIPFNITCKPFASSEILGAAFKRSSGAKAFPSFIAYSAYCACAILLPFTHCLNERVRLRALQHVEANVRVIQSMSKYWKFAALLDSYLRPMADMHSKNPFHPEDEPRSLQPFHLGGFGVALPRARTSVLTHTGILWKDDGFAVQGEEITESQLMENSEIRMQSPDGTSVNSGGEDHPGGF